LGSGITIGIDEVKIIMTTTVKRETTSMWSP